MAIVCGWMEIRFVQLRWTEAENGVRFLLRESRSTVGQLLGEMSARCPAQSCSPRAAPTVLSQVQASSGRTVVEVDEAEIVVVAEDERAMVARTREGTPETKCPAGGLAKREVHMARWGEEREEGERGAGLMGI